MATQPATYGSPGTETAPKMLAQNCGNDLMVLKTAPPLVATEEQFGALVTAIRGVVDMAGTAAFRAEAIGMARRAVNI